MIPSRAASRRSRPFPRSARCEAAPTARFERWIPEGGEDAKSPASSDLARLPAPVSPVDQTLDEVAHTSRAHQRARPILFVVLEADRPPPAGARFSLVGVETVTLGRGDARVATRSADGRSLDVRVPGQWLSTQHVASAPWGASASSRTPGRATARSSTASAITSHVLREGDVVEAGRVFLTVRGAPAAGRTASSATRTSAARTQPFGFRTLLPGARGEPTPPSRASRGGAPCRSCSSGRPARARRSSRARCTPSRGGRAVHRGQLRRAAAVARREPPLRAREGGLLGGGARRGRLRALRRRGDALPRRDRRSPGDVAGGAAARPAGARGHPDRRHARGEGRRARRRRDAPRRSRRSRTSGGFRSDLLARLNGYTHRLPRALRPDGRLRRHPRRRAVPRRRGARGAAHVRRPRRRGRCSPTTGRSTSASSIRRWRARWPSPRTTSSSRRTCRPSSSHPAPPSAPPAGEASPDEVLRDRSSRSSTSTAATSPRSRARWGKRRPRFTAGCTASRSIRITYRAR